MLWVIYSVGNSTGKKTQSVSWVPRHAQAGPYNARSLAPPRSHPGLISSVVLLLKLWSLSLFHCVLSLAFHH